MIGVEAGELPSRGLPAVKHRLSGAAPSLLTQRPASVRKVALQVYPIYIITLHLDMQTDNRITSLKVVYGGRSRPVVKNQRGH